MIVVIFDDSVVVIDSIAEQMLVRCQMAVDEAHWTTVNVESYAHCAFVPLENKTH